MALQVKSVDERGAEVGELRCAAELHRLDELRFEDREHLLNPGLAVPVRENQAKKCGEVSVI